jgi:type IV conjugative transfer system coupling protein TraD
MNPIPSPASPIRGAGKSTMIRELLGQVRTRGKKAVVFDLTGSFIEAFYDADRDIILNPFDARCPHWNIFHDCESRAEFTSAAEALIPSDGGGAEPFWIQAARILFVEACVRLAEEGLTTNESLYDNLMTATLKEVNARLGGSIASPLTDPQAARMAESIRATMNTNITALQCLPSDGKPFSVKAWVAAEPPGGSVLFIAARHVDLSTVKVLLTLWMDMAINAMMTLPPSPRDVRTWFLFDEIGALHRLPAIEKGMQTARNYGGAFVLGVHTIAKLRDTYGDKIAETLGSLARTKLILATADYTSATWCSQQIGNGEWREMEEGYSFGYANVRDAVTLTNKRQLEPLVLPDDISKLPDLSGWLVFPQGFPAAKVTLEIRQWPRQAHGFVPRSDLNKPLRKIDDAKPTGGDDGGLGVETRPLPSPPYAPPVPPDVERKVDDVKRAQTRQGQLLLAAPEPDRSAARDMEQERAPRETDKASSDSEMGERINPETGEVLPDSAPDPKARKDRGIEQTEDLIKRENTMDFGNGKDDPESEQDMELGM